MAALTGWGCVGLGFELGNDALRSAVELPRAAGEYYGTVWLESDVLVLVSVENYVTRIATVDEHGTETATVSLPARPECHWQAISAFPLPTGEFGAAVHCDEQFGPEPRTANVLAIDPRTSAARDLGQTSHVVLNMTWRGDMSSAVYSAFDRLCATLYRHEKDGDEPLNLLVTIEGQPVSVGEDLTATPGGCTTQAIADYPAYARDGKTLAFVAARVAGHDGSERSLQPFSLFVVENDGNVSNVVQEILDPAGVVWSGTDVIYFSGTVDGIEGIWSVGRDGLGLTRISARVLDKLSIAPDGHALSGVGVRGDAPKAYLISLAHGGQ